MSYLVSLKAGVNLNFREKCDFLFFPENYPSGIKVKAGVNLKNRAFFEKFSHLGF